MTPLINMLENAKCGSRNGQLSALHDASNNRLWHKLPKDQIERVMKSDYCDIDPEFLGFVGIYERLADIVPLDWTVVDLGCAYAPQAFFFENHAGYIGVDLSGHERFSARNTRHVSMAIADFLRDEAKSLPQMTTFAICSYVPPWGADNATLARTFFQNVFTFYPAALKSSPTREGTEWTV